MRTLKAEIETKYPDYKVVVNVTNDNNVIRTYEIWEKNVNLTKHCAKSVVLMNKFGYIYIMNRTDNCKTLVENFDELNYKRWVEVFFEQTALLPERPEGMPCFICKGNGDSLQCQGCFNTVCLKCCNQVEKQSCPFCRKPGFIFQDTRPWYQRF